MLFMASGLDTAIERTAHKGFVPDIAHSGSVPILEPKTKNFTCSLQMLLSWIALCVVPHELAPCVVTAGLIIPSTTTRGRTTVDQIVTVILDGYSISFQRYFH